MESCRLPGAARAVATVRPVKPSRKRERIHSLVLLAPGMVLCSGTIPTTAEKTRRLRHDKPYGEKSGDELRYELKKAWRDGTRFVMQDPYALITRICAMVPPPRFHMVRFHGVLAPNSA